MTTATDRSALRLVIRRAIDATIKEHGHEIWLGEGYAPDVTLIDKLVEALSSSASSPSAVEAERERVLALMESHALRYLHPHFEAQFREVIEFIKDDVRKDSSSVSSETPRLFPVQNGPDIPWSIIAPFEKQAQRQHHQTLERLAERQGLCVAEVLSIIDGEGYYRKYWIHPDRNEHDTTTNILRLCAIVAERSAASSETQEERPDLSEIARSLKRKAAAQSSPVPQAVSAGVTELDWNLKTHAKTIREALASSTSNDEGIVMAMKCVDCGSMVPIGQSCSNCGLGE